MWRKGHVIICRRIGSQRFSVNQWKGCGNLFRYTSFLRYSLLWPRRWVTAARRRSGATGRCGAGWKQERAAYMPVCRAASPVRAPGRVASTVFPSGAWCGQNAVGSRGARTWAKGIPACGDRARRLVSLLESLGVAGTPFCALPSLSVSISRLPGDPRRESAGTFWSRFEHMPGCNRELRSSN